MRHVKTCWADYPDRREIPGGATMSEDVEEAQELPVNPAGRGGEDAGKERTMPLSIALKIAGRAFKERVWVTVAELAMETDLG